MNNRQTIAAYYAQHRDEIVGFVALRLGGSNVSEDIVQDIFVRLLQSDKLISPTTLPALVFTMARNAVADWYRRHRVHEEYEHYLKCSGNVSESMESVISAHELMERMEYTLARLAPECREVYRLHIAPFCRLLRGFRQAAGSSVPSGFRLYYPYVSIVIVGLPERKPFLSRLPVIIFKSERSSFYEKPDSNPGYF